MSRYEIAGIAPFNESVFNNCTYPIRFSILRHFGRIIDPLVLNEFHSFACAHDPLLGRSLLFVNTHFVASPDDVLSGVLGVTQESKATCADVIGDLAAAIRGGRPVMLSIDRFYQPCVPQFFGRQHHLHSVLVHACDDEARTFGLFDDNAGRGQEIVACTLSDDDLLRAYSSCQQLWRRQLDIQPTFVAFSAGAAPVDSLRAAASARAAFLEASLRSRDVIAAAVDHLAMFAARFADEALAPASPEAFGLYYAFFKRIAEFKATHQYQTRFALDGGAAAVAAEGEALLKEWNRVRVRVQRATIDQRPEALPAYVADISARLRALVGLERRYQASYFAALETAVNQISAVPVT